MSTEWGDADVALVAPLLVLGRNVSIVVKWCKMVSDTLKGIKCDNERFFNSLNSHQVTSRTTHTHIDILAVSENMPAQPNMRLSNDVPHTCPFHRGPR